MNNLETITEIIQDSGVDFFRRKLSMQLKEKIPFNVDTSNIILQPLRTKLLDNLQTSLELVMYRSLTELKKQ